MGSERGGSLLLRGGRVIDGSGAPTQVADVAVHDGAVTDVGPGLLTPSGAAVVDVTGLVVAPGFIDLHTHCDFTLPQYPRADSMVRQGVTTIVTGNCGSTPYPVDAGRAGLLRDSTAHLGSRLEWNWRDAGGYADMLDREPLALNVVLLVGHTSIRIAAMGFERRPPTEEELAVMRRFVSDAMEQGCAGLSSGLIYSPGSYAEIAELVSLATVAAERGGFYATHMRNEGPALLAAVEEALTIASSSGAGLQLSHHKVLGRRNWGLTKRSLARVAEAQAAGMDVLLDQYPYDATSTTLTALLPTWMLEGGVAAMRDRLRDDQIRAAARVEMLDGPTDGRPKRDFEPETVTIASIHSGRRDGFTGRNIAAIGEDDIRRVMRNPSVAVASDGWTLSPEAGGTPHPRSYGTFARVLGHYSRDESVIPIEEAVRKMTSLPARRLGMTDRGCVRPGARADLVVFDPSTVIDRATYEQPHRFCGGVHHVFIDGTEVIREGIDTGAMTGAVLRRQGEGFARRGR